MVSFIFFIFLSLICASSSLETTCGTKELDAKLSLLTKFPREVHMPTNHQEANIYCRTYKKDLTQAEEYNEKCNQGQSATILTVSLKAMEKITMKQYCKIKAERERSLDASNCFNSGKDTASQCWPQMISSITLASNWSDGEVRKPLLCCSLIKWRDCFMKAYEGIGGPICTKANIETIDQYLHKSLMDPMRIFCAGYLSTDKCDKYGKILDSLKTTKVEYLTPFPAMLELFTNFYDEPDYSDSNEINSSRSFHCKIMLILLASCIYLFYYIKI